MAATQSGTSLDSEHITQKLQLKDGRTLAYACYGETASPKSLPVFYFNGTPGSHPECGLLHEPALKLGLLLIGIDRPGFGDSSWQDNRTLLQWPSDVLELADHLDVPKFGIIGLSGGGPHALACLSEIPKERLVAVTVISGMCPMSLGNEGMMWQTRAFFGLARWSTWLLTMLLDLTLARTLRTGDRKKLIALVKKQNDTLPVPEADKKVMAEICEDGKLINAYLGSSQGALKTSSKAAAWEMWLLGSDWGFKLADLDGSRLTMWHGGQDVNVPATMPDKAHKLIPDATYKRHDDEGHVSLVVRHGEAILTELMKRLDSSQEIHT